jgi:hypothetical protein
LAEARAAVGAGETGKTGCGGGDTSERDALLAKIAATKDGGGCDSAS